MNIEPVLNKIVTQVKFYLRYIIIKLVKEEKSCSALLFNVQCLGEIEGIYTRPCLQH